MPGRPGVGPTASADAPRRTIVGVTGNSTIEHAAKVARERYGCLAPWQEDPALYGRATLRASYDACEGPVVRQCRELLEQALELATAYMRTREQFGRPIAEFQGLQWMLVDMGTGIEAARLMIMKAAAGAEAEEGSGFPDIAQAARAKILASETAIRVTNDALQVFGAAGYSRNFPLERMVRDARMFTIGGGTAQILRTVIASQILGIKLPQTRDGHLKLAEKEGVKKKG